MCVCVCSRAQLKLSGMSKEQTHKLELPLEEDKGTLVLLVTLTASTAVSISDLSLNGLDDPAERHQILRRYVSPGALSHTRRLVRRSAAASVCMRWLFSCS